MNRDFIDRKHETSWDLASLALSVQRCSDEAMEGFMREFIIFCCLLLATQYASAVSQDETVIFAAAEHDFSIGIFDEH